MKQIDRVRSSPVYSMHGYYWGVGHATASSIAAPNGELSKKEPPGIPRVLSGAAAFTLLEVLIVMGIIALLIALLLPALSHAQAHAQRMKCESNLNQIGAGIELYSETNGHLPYDGTGAGLMRALTSVRVSGVMSCPSDATGEPSYAMTAGYSGMPKSSGDADAILIYEMVARHNGEAGVLYFDGHVDER